MEEAEKERKREEELKERAQFIQDEKDFGTTVANLKKFFASKEVQAVKELSGQLSGLMKSRNATLFNIGKAASLANIAINTAEGALSAFTSAQALGPIVGPVVGALAAAAVIAFGVEQAATVASTQFAAQSGGIVPNATAGTSRAGLRDSVPTFLEPGELVVPKNIAPDFIQSIGRPDGGDDFEGEGGSGNQFNLNIETLISEDDDAVSTLFAKFQDLVQFNNAEPLTQ